jgi:hypothetical protein
VSYNNFLGWALYKENNTLQVSVNEGEFDEQMKDYRQLRSKNTLQVSVNEWEFEEQMKDYRQLRIIFYFGLKTLL